jgi:5-methylcytosine-specific restriction enzyme subunit McrC
MSAEPDIAGATDTPASATWRSHAGIPVRNLWLLLMYASDLAAFGERFDGLANESADLPELLARLLNCVVERRLRQNLSRDYVPTSGVLRRVRGRIDWLRTETGQHLNRGEVVCRFEDLTADTPRNRLVRAGLDAMAARVAHRDVARRSASLARQLAEQGVGPQRPSRSEMARDRIARHDAHDKLMVKIAELALDLVLPAEAAGDTSATRLERDEVLLRRIFERAVAGFYRHELHGEHGWLVTSQASLAWNVTSASADFSAWLPGMNADVVLDQTLLSQLNRRVVVETKFADALTSSAFREEVFKSGHLYQLYAYLQTQAGRGEPAIDNSEGVLLYPVVDRNLDEFGIVQGHRIKVATVDLTMSAGGLRSRLRDIVSPVGTGE